jgi:hypothetical protein
MFGKQDDHIQQEGNIIEIAPAVGHSLHVLSRSSSWIAVQPGCKAIHWHTLWSFIYTPG